MQPLRIKLMDGLGNRFAMLKYEDLPNNLKPSLQHNQADWVVGLFNGLKKDFAFDQMLCVGKEKNTPEEDENNTSHSPSQALHLDYWIFNNDGSRAWQCGNGARAVAKWLYDEGFYLGQKPTKLTLHLSEKQSVQTHYESDERIWMSSNFVSFTPQSLNLEVSHRQLKPVDERNWRFKTEYATYEFCALSVGNPHAIITLDNEKDWQNFPLEKAAKLFNQEIFSQGVNLSLVALKPNAHAKLKTYERGAGLTDACGTGALASFIALHYNQKVGDKLTFKLKHGELALEKRTDKPHWWMRGPAREWGEVAIDIKPLTKV